MATALNQQQQLKNEATKMAMRVPLFYGNKKEDTMNIKDFITRFESACNAMGLGNDAEKWKLSQRMCHGNVDECRIRRCRR